MRWESEVAAQIEVTLAGPLGARVPVGVRNVRFDGTVRLIATPLLQTAPGFGALLVSLPSAPRIGLDVTIAGGEVTKLPWLRDEVLQQAVQAALAKELLWPNRLVLPQGKAPSAEPPPVLGREALAALIADDPLLRAERALEAVPAVSALAKERTPTALEALLEIFVNSTNKELGYW
jgi:hypothetical protein